MITVQPTTRFVRTSHFALIWLWAGLFLLSASCRLHTQPTSVDKRDIRQVRISAHRGGPEAGYPENALETLKHTAEQIPGVMLEVDIRHTRDGVLVLLHDRTLDRTTTRSGPLEQFRLDELADARLVDALGTPTSYRLPTLLEVCEWIQEADAYLSLDVKDTADLRPVAELLGQYDIRDKAELITYSLEPAIRLHRHDPRLHLSISIGNEDALDRALESGIDPNRVAAFTGVGLKDVSLYRRLKSEGMVVTLGSLGNLDRRAQARGDVLYREWASLGIDRFATDRPRDVYKVFNTAED